MKPGSHAPVPIALVGLPGSGKSTLGHHLAQRLSWELRDTDSEIERRTGRSPAEIIDQQGESAFRDLEREAVTRLLGAGRPAVIACGGGLFAEPEVADRLLRGAWVVALDAADATLLERVGDAPDRPLLRADPAGRLAELRRRREPAHARAHLRIDTGRTSVEAAAAAIGALADSVRVSDGATTYPVVVGEGAADHVECHLPAASLRVAVVADRRVLTLGRRIATRLRQSGRQAGLVALGAGERAKTWVTAGRLLERLAQLGLGRGDAVVAVGGGSLGDVAGFAAASYHRGIAWVVVPTTLLAMVDSAIGGKTGVNLRAGKNLAGAFWQPRAVLADPTVLDTLAPREMASGLAEVVKYAMIADSELPALLERRLVRGGRDDVLTVTAMVEGCAAIKAQVVGSDAREAGLRAVLNYGHTTAHAIEAATGYGPVTHGEAVAAGMRVAGRLSTELAGLARADLEWQDRMLARLDLQPLPRIDPEAVLSRLGHDKKAVGGEPRWVLLARRGDPRIGERVPEALVREAVTEVLRR